MKLPVLSHSFLSTYERCPKQAYHKYVLRDQPYVETQAIKWGNEVHKALELAINTGKPLPEGMEGYGKYLSALGEGCKAELELGVTYEGKPCGFWDTQCFFRGKIDVLKRVGDTAFIVDWKTGKPREDPAELYAHGMLVQIHSAGCSALKGAYVWLKEGKVGPSYDLRENSPAMITLGNIRRLRAEMEQRQQTGTEWPAKQNPLCGWCSVKTCRYNPEFE